MTPNPTKQIISKSAKITTAIPLCSIENCQYKDCDMEKNSSKIYENKKTDRVDSYWSEFLKAQEQSTANYLYKIQIYGQNKDPTLKKRKSFPNEVIKQYQRYIPSVGSLNNDDMFLILAFILNMGQLKSGEQKEYMDKLHDQGLLDMEILTYIKVISNYLRTEKELQNYDSFFKILNKSIERENSIGKRNYFNPENLFMKVQGEMDPYELTYLKNIMNSQNQEELNTQEFLYLLNFLEKLKELPETEMIKFLEKLHNKNVIPSMCLHKLEIYLKMKAKKFNPQKLKNLWSHFEYLMDLQSCFPETPICNKELPMPQVTLDIFKIKKSLKGLLKGGIPNIVHVMELKKFIRNILQLDNEILEQTLLQLKNMHLITVEEFKFIYTYISREYREGCEEKKSMLMKILQKISSTPPNPIATVAFTMPIIKKPIPTIINFM